MSMSIDRRSETPLELLLCFYTRLYYRLNRVKVQHSSDIENHQKIAFCMPRPMGQVGIRGPPLPNP